MSEVEERDEDGFSLDEWGNPFGYCNACGEEAPADSGCCEDGEVVPCDEGVRVAAPEFFAESCLPSGCSCGCHNPAYGIHYSHLVPCCDQPLSSADQ